MIKYLFSVQFLFFVLCVPVFPGEYLNNPAYIAQVGYGETKADAEQNALAAISKYFSMQISVSTSEHATVSDGRAQSTVTDDVLVTSETELFSVQYTKPKFDKKQKLYEVTAYIDRQAAWEVYEPRLEERVRSFLGFFSLAEKEVDPLSQMLKFTRALQNAEESELEKRFAFADSLYPDGAAFYSSTREKLSLLESKIRSLSGKSRVFVACENDHEDILLRGVQEIFSNAHIQVVDSKEKADYVCTIFATENMQSLPAGTFYTPSFTLQITKSEKAVYSASGKAKKTGAKNEKIARQRAYSALSESVKNALKKDFMLSK